MIIKFLFKKKNLHVKVFSISSKKKNSSQTQLLLQDICIKKLLRINLLFYVHISNVSFFTHKNENESDFMIEPIA